VTRRTRCCTSCLTPSYDGIRDADVAARTTVEAVGTYAAVEEVVAGPATQHITPAEPEETVRPVVAAEPIVTVPTEGVLDLPELQSGRVAGNDPVGQVERHATIQSDDTDDVLPRAALDCTVRVPEHVEAVSPATTAGLRPRHDIDAVPTPLSRNFGSRSTGEVVVARPTEDGIVTPVGAGHPATGLTHRRAENVVTRSAADEVATKTLLSPPRESAVDEVPVLVTEKPIRMTAADHGRHIDKAIRSLPGRRARAKVDCHAATRAVVHNGVDIGGSTSVHPVDTGTRPEPVVVRSTAEHVGAAPAVQLVTEDVLDPGPREQPVRASAAECGVDAEAVLDDIRAWSADEHVVPAPTANEIVTAVRRYGVVPTAGHDDVRAFSAYKLVVAVRAGNRGGLPTAGGINDSRRGPCDTALHIRHCHDRGDAQRQRGSTPARRRCWELSWQRRHGWMFAARGSLPACRDEAALCTASAEAEPWLRLRL
jgi:hypothetical protein